MNFSSWAIRRPIPSLVLFIVLTLMGLFAFNKIKVQLFPDIELPIVVVTVPWQGADADNLESEVVRKVEDSLVSLDKLKHIRTTIVEGTATVMAEFELEKDADLALDDVRNAVTSVRSDLPAGIDEPVFSKTSISGSPVAYYEVQSDNMDNVELSWFVDNQIAKAVMKADGVGKVDRVGGVNREIQLNLDTALMNGFGVTAADVSRALAGINKDFPAGIAKLGLSEQSIRVKASHKSLEDLAQLQIPLKTGGYIRLVDISELRDTNADVSTYALLDGKPVVSFNVSRTKGAGEIEVLKNVEAELAKFKELNPTVKINQISETTRPIAHNYKDSMGLLLEGSVLAVIVVFIFLKDVRATFIAAVALPLSLVPTFWFMNELGFSLNTVTLLSMSLVIGILVDDAIVEVENIERHMAMGKTPFQAAMDGADEIGMAVIATTITLIAVFLPTAFMSGVAGKFFYQFGWTAVISVFFSLVVARLLTPMMAAYMMKPKKHHDPKDGKIMTWYLGMVRTCLKNKLLTVIAALLVFVLGIGLATKIPGEFVPTADISRSAVNIELPPGTSLNQTLALSEKVRQDMLSDIPEIQKVYTVVGTSFASDAFIAGGPSQARNATLNLILSDRNDRVIKQKEIEAKLRERLHEIPGARITVGTVDSQSNYVVSISSDDKEKLATTADAAINQIRTIPGLGNISSSDSLRQPELQIRPDFAKAAQAGVSVQDMADTVRIATNADYDKVMPKLSLPERQVPIRIKMDEVVRHDVNSIGQLRVQGNQGLVPLSSVANISFASGASQINRYDRFRNVSITIEPNSVPLGQLGAEIDKLEIFKKLPPGVNRQETGDAQAMKELSASFAIAMGSGILAVYFVLVLLFHNFSQPFTILAALPLSAGGAMGALYLSGYPLSMPAMIGMIMLIGVVTKNSILLVDYAIIEYEKSGDRHSALIEACHKRSRPIVMTTIAMVAGMIPIAMGTGEADPSFRSPMAIVVIGGLITSTLLSLLVIPVIYTLNDKAANGVMRGLAKLGLKKQDQAATSHSVVKTKPNSDSNQSKKTK